MAEAMLQAEIDAAKAYEVLMVPALFREWAATVADAAHVQSGERVLDLACGTGVLAREVRSRMGAADLVTGLDPSAGMLEVARKFDPSVEWRQGMAESLPFPDASFDVVVSQFGFMFFSDRSGALREVVRVLRPGGRMALAVWDFLENIPAYADEVALLERLVGIPASDALRAPFVLGDRRALETLLTGAKLEAVEVATRKGTARFPSVRVMVEADLRGWLPVMGVVLTEEQIVDVLQAAEEALRQYVADDGTVAFGTSAHIVIGVKP